MPRSPFLSSAWAVLRRDALEEIRKRISLAAILFFAASTLALISFSIGSVSLPPADRARLNSGLLWILLFFSASTGLPRSYVREEETGSALALRKIAAGETVLAGKFLFNYVLFLLIALAASPLLCLLLDWHLQNPAAFAAVLALAGFGLAFVSTFLSAIISRAGQKNVLFALTAFPLVLPLLLPAALATALAASEPATSAIVPYFRILFSYDGVAACGGFLLIRFVWEG